MPVFKDHKININHLLGFIPEALIAHLSATTRVDYYTKVLHGKKMFYLLMYGILENDRLSQRTLEDSFNDPVFKLLFDGMLPCHSDVFTAAGYASEDIALSEAIMGHVKKDGGHRNIYVMARGLQSTHVMKAFNDQKVTFIARAKENRKFVELESFIGANQDLI